MTGACRWTAFLVVSAIATVVGATVHAAPEIHAPSELVGTWRGTSTCTDRVAAPACKDEVVVYEFVPGEKPGAVRWKAYKIGDGEQGLMGEMDLAYDTDEGCWRGEFVSPRTRTVWCVTVSDDRLTGRAWMLPGKERIRAVDARKD